MMVSSIHQLCYFTEFLMSLALYNFIYKEKNLLYSPTLLGIKLGRRFNLLILKREPYHLRGKSNSHDQHKHDKYLFVFQLGDNGETCWFGLGVGLSSQHKIKETFRKAKWGYIHTGIFLRTFFEKNMQDREGGVSEKEKHGGPKTKPVSKSIKTGLQIPRRHGRSTRFLRKRLKDSGGGAPVYMAAVLLAAEAAGRGGRERRPGEAAGRGGRERRPGEAAGRGGRERRPGEAAGRGGRERRPGEAAGRGDQLAWEVAWGRPGKAAAAREKRPMRGGGVHERRWRS
ncbi:hypothetical protein N665_1332s0007 [Sinapis alba]|nr:hypothetical protein N665_1332s0007 [Sinapis alba]